MNLRPWLIGSLVLNAMLAGVVAWAAMVRQDVPLPFSVARQLTNRTLRVRTTVQESAPTVVAVNAPFRWGDVESADYRVYMANLRAIGCPERTIRDIIVADVDQLFIQRMRERFYPLHQRIWWMLANEEKAKELGDATEKQWDALVNDRKAVLKELIGTEEPYAREDEEESAMHDRARWSHTLDFLPPEKQDRVLSLRKATETAIRELWVTDRELTHEERQQRQQRQHELEADRDRQLAEALTLDELAEYQLRTSDGANQRHRLSRTEFSEEEVRVIATLNTHSGQQQRQVTGDNAEARQRRQEIAHDADAQLQAVLGEARFAEYQRAGDDRFQQISQVVERYGLPEEKAVSVYDLQREARACAAQVRADAARPAEERQALQQAIRDETERSLKAALGAKAFATLERRGAAGWLSELTKLEK